jgi:DNA repair exonuclease SbcCD ATPase subunit
MENVIRDMVTGTNLNENYGYTTQEVPNRLRQRQFAEAEAQVGVTQNQLATVAVQIVQAQADLAEREQTLAEHQTRLAQAHKKRRAEKQARQQAGQTLRRVEQQLAGLDRQADQLAERRKRLLGRTQYGALAILTARQAALTLKLTARLAARVAIDLTQPMFERGLEKDQIMTNFQAILRNAHQWCGAHYFSGEWSRLELETASARIYRQRGYVAYAAHQVTVTLAAFANQAEQDLAEAACRKFDGAQVRDAAGRLIVMGVAPFVHCVRHL